MKRRELLAKVQEEVNRFPFVSDDQLHRRADFWERVATYRAGDCDDFVLEKRARLLEVGVPIEHLRLAAVFTEPGPTHGYHLVLVARDGEGDWILDQRQAHLMTEDEMVGLGYTCTSPTWPIETAMLQVPGRATWEPWKF